MNSSSVLHSHSNKVQRWVLEAWKTVILKSLSSGHSKTVTENQPAHNFVVSIHVPADLVLKGSAHSQAEACVRV